jgi:hypothetical protein
MLRSKLFSVSVLLTICGFSNTAQADDWSRFRQQFPFHVQTIAVSQAGPDGTRTLIVSEPPPHVTLESIRALDPALGAAAVRAHPIGMDGFVRDVVAELPPMRDAEFAALADRLHLYLFSSTYKAYTLQFDGAAQTARAPELNLRVSAADLRDWLVRSSEHFVAPGEKAGSTIQQLLLAGRAGVFYSVRPGLVAWVIERKRDLAETKRQIRRFALDSDLILGAIPGTSHVAVIARERQTPVDWLPPLRTETVLLLAAVGSDELSQSYERGNFLAGKLEDNNDWAPIYLSDPLIDTEYGSLLNITDQLLKSWSSGGKTWYRGFTYPAPPSYPFGGVPLLKVIKSSEVTFNWNTKGAGYLMQSPGLQFMALNRTGSLPVTYIPEGASAGQLRLVNNYEEEGYNFFSSQKDPNLVRVVQYAALYQMFRAFNIKSGEPVLTERAHPESAALIKDAQAALKKFAEQKDKVLEVLVQLLIQPKYQNEAQTEVKSLQNRLRDYAATSGDTNYAHLARILTDPRRTPAVTFQPARGNLALGYSRSGFSEYLSQLRARERESTAHELAASLRSGIGAEVMQAIAVDTDRAKDDYAAAARRETNSWIKTPSYVVSTSFDAKRVRGGHNLDSKLSYYRTSPDVPRGKVRIVEDALTGRKTVLVNDADAPAIPALLRANAVAKDPAPVLKQQLDRILESAKPSSLPREQTLRLAEPLLGTAPPSRRGFTSLHLSDARGARSGWEFSPNAVQADYRSTPVVASRARPAPAAGLGSRAIAVDRNPDFTYTITLPDTDAPIVARSYDAAIDAVTDRIKDTKTPAGRWRIHFSGFDEPEATKFLRTTEVQFRAAERVELAGFGRASESPFSPLNQALKSRYDVARARIVESKLEVIDRGLATERKVLDMSLELPPYGSSARPSFFVRVRIFFSKFVPESVRLSVENIVAKALRSPGVTRQGVLQPPLAEDLIFSIRRDLKMMKVPGLSERDVHIQLSGDWGDSFAAGLLETETGNGRSSG